MADEYVRQLTMNRGDKCFKALTLRVDFAGWHLHTIVALIEIMPNSWHVNLIFLVTHYWNTVTYFAIVYRNTWYNVQNVPSFFSTKRFRYIQEIKKNRKKYRINSHISSWTFYWQIIDIGLAFCSMKRRNRLTIFCSVLNCYAFL